MMRVIHASAPVRIADNGGWTDTWFARHGCVLNIAVNPGVDVTIRASPRSTSSSPVALHLSGDDYAYDPQQGRPGRHPLLEAVIQETGVPESLALDITIGSTVPPGASTGTSASVTVALLAAIAAVWGRSPGPMALAMTAHDVEMHRVGWQCGVQDQLAAAFGGINFIEIDAFPAARVEPIVLSPAAAGALEARLLLIYSGAPHRSSDIHKRVIAELEAEGAAAPRLDELRRCARDARQALCDEDLEAFGASLSRNTEAQARLHPTLVGGPVRDIVTLARRHRASGWKVNGAGGDGGTVTLLMRADPDAHAALLSDLRASMPAARVLPVRLARHGATVR